MSYITNESDTCVSSATLSRSASQMRDEIRLELQAIDPLDPLEQEHRADALAWIASGAGLLRIAKPATPPKHLVSYVAVIDANHILLVDHKNAQLWLPAGGHVEPDEHRRQTAARELAEELGFAPKHPIGARVMVSCTRTVGLTAKHIDVSLWYVVRADRRQRLAYDESEFNAVRWFPFTEVPLVRSDPHMSRFLTKLGAKLAVRNSRPAINSRVNR